MNKKQEENMMIMFVALLVLCLIMVMFVAFSLDHLVDIKDSIQNKTLEQNQTLAYEVGYAQCIAEVNQAIEEGRLG